MTRRGLVGLVAWALLAFPAAALADVRTGTAADPAGDSTAPARDVTAVTVTYDTTGAVTAAITFAATPQPGEQADIGIAIGTAADCAAPLVILTAPLDPADATPPFWQTSAGESGSGKRAISGQTVTISAQATALAGAYDCAYAETFELGVVDEVAPFGLGSGTSPAPTPDPTPPPTPQPPGGGDDDPKPASFYERDRPGDERTGSQGRIYAICGFDLCRVDPATRRVSRVAKGTEEKPYESAGASRSGAALAFARDGDVFRSRRRARDRTRLGAGQRVQMRADGRAVAWTGLVPSPQCPPGGAPCTLPPTPALFRRASGDPAATAFASPVATGGWLRRRIVLQRDASVCLAGAGGACERPVAQDPARYLSTPAASADGRRRRRRLRAAPRGRRGPGLPRPHRPLRPRDRPAGLQAHHRRPRRRPGLLAQRPQGRLQPRRRSLRRAGPRRPRAPGQARRRSHRPGLGEALTRAAPRRAP